MSNWYKTVEQHIDRQRPEFTEKEQTAHKLDLFLRAAIRIDEFASECEKCHAIQAEMLKTAKTINLVRTEKAAQKESKRIRNLALGHLRKKHGLSHPMENRLLWGCFGMAFGASIGLTYNQYIPGIIVGGVVGTVGGILRDRQMAKQGRTI